MPLPAGENPFVFGLLLLKMQPRLPACVQDEKAADLCTQVCR